MLFSKRFTHIVKEDLSGLKSKGFGDPGLNVRQVGTYQNAHHQRDNTGAKNGVADSRKAPQNSTEHKIELLRKGTISNVPLNPDDVLYIKKQYGISNDNKPRKLGSTGITLSMNPQTNQYNLSK